jgi:hypothetical protein
VFTSGPIKGNTSESGEITKWKDSAPLHGPIKENIPDIIWMIKNMVKDFLNGKLIFNL